MSKNNFTETTESNPERDGTEPNNPTADIPETKAEEIKSSGGITTSSADGSIHALVIAGVVEGHYAADSNAKTTKYEQCIPTLVAVEESDTIGGLLVLLNTVGGDVEAGLAIAELIAGMTKPSVSLVLGGGHSIGIPLAVSATRSFIVPSATMTLHPVRTNGTVIGVPQSFDYFTKMQKRIVRFITENSRADEAALYRMIMKTDEMASDMGSVLEGEDAVAAGLIDEIGGLGKAVSSLKKMIAESKRR